MSASKPVHKGSTELCKFDPLWDINPEAAQKIYGVADRDGAPLAKSASKSKFKKSNPSQDLNRTVAGAKKSYKTSKSGIILMDGPVGGLGTHATADVRYRSYLHNAQWDAKKNVFAPDMLSRSPYWNHKAHGSHFFKAHRTDSSKLRLAGRPKISRQKAEVPNPGKLKPSGPGKYRPGTGFIRERGYVFVQDVTRHLDEVDRRLSQK